MTLPQIIVLLTTLMAIGGVMRLYAKLLTERAKRIEAIQKLCETRAEVEEWKETARANLEAWRKMCGRVPKLRNEVTTQFMQIDSMLHGDRRCVNHHRYYTGQGISCPWCGGEEIEDCPIYTVGMDAMRFGIQSDETGIDVREFTVTLSPE